MIKRRWNIILGLAMMVMAVASIAFGWLDGVGTSHAAGPDFRIIDVSAHDGQMLVEVEHFKADGSFDYFENYLWPGREGKRFAMVTDADGLLLLDTGSIAPFTIHPNSGRFFQYRPLGHDWKRATTPHMDNGSVLSVIQQIHDQRKDWGLCEWEEFTYEILLVDGVPFAVPVTTKFHETENCKRGQNRLTEPPIKRNARDDSGINALVAKFRGLGGNAYLSDQSGDLLAYSGVLPEINPGGGQVEYGTVSTFYPEGGPNPEAIDGSTGRGGVDETWGTIKGSAGNESSDSATTITQAILASTTTNQWEIMRRSVFLFDTRSLDDGWTISAATMGLVITSVTDDFSDSLSMVTTTPASDTALVDADFNVGNWTTTKQATDLTLAGLTADSSTYNDFTLNSTGRGNISLDGVTKFGIRNTSENDSGTQPGWGSNSASFAIIASSEEVLSGDKRPRLVVTHNTATAAITGTIGDGAAEQEVRNGEGTIIITLSEDAWVDGIAFNDQINPIIQGLDSAQSEPNGWNARVRDQLPTTAVVRTSSTVVTITLAMVNVRNYSIDSNETITVTVPADALAGTQAPITATPAFAITAALESLAISGTLGGSGGTTGEIVAGGETVIATLTNTVWGGDTGIAASFDAANSESLTIPDNTSLSTGDIDFTMAGWFYFDSFPSNEKLTGKWVGGQQEWTIQWASGGGNVLRFSVSSDGSDLDSIFDSHLGTPSLNIWYFVVVWHDASANTINIQIDDDTADSLAHSTGVFDGTAPFRIGVSDSDFFDGRSASVGFWKRILTSSEKTFMHNSGFGRRYDDIGITGTDCADCKTSLEGWWNQDEISGTRDDSHGSNNLTDSNSVTSDPWTQADMTDDSRQAIIDAMESNLSDQNGWDASRSGISTSDVVKTSVSVATITLPALTSYAIPRTETITTTMTSGAMIYVPEIVGTPTFDIVPTFQTSGTRVSNAIDLSSVTDVAYCAIGWESNEPANTTVLIETSVDGGANYSTATNGSCPTGLTVGESLSIITDFRVKVTLTTSDTSATPLITALGLIVEDSSGQELYYQLNTTPSATLTDRSGNGNTGTMSFPIQPSGTSISTAPMRSTESQTATSPGLPIQDVAAAVTGSATSPNIFGPGTGFTGLPGQGIVEAISTAGDGLPESFVWKIFLGVFIIGAGFVALILTGDLIIAAAAMALVMGFQMAVGNGLLEGYIIFLFLALASGFFLFRKGLPL